MVKTFWWADGPWWFKSPGSSRIRPMLQTCSGSASSSSLECRSCNCYNSFWKRKSCPRGVLWIMFWFSISQALWMALMVLSSVAKRKRKRRSIATEQKYLQDLNFAGQRYHPNQELQRIMDGIPNILKSWDRICCSCYVSWIIPLLFFGRVCNKKPLIKCGSKPFFGLYILHRSEWVIVGVHITQGKWIIFHEQLTTHFVTLFDCW